MVMLPEAAATPRPLQRARNVLSPGAWCGRAPEVRSRVASSTLKPLFDSYSQV